ncbi:MAG: amidohydrolase, partial [Woeseiaceae bacterium]
MRILVLLLLAGTVGAAETALHNFNGYTSTDTGIHAFSVLVVAEDGRVIATGDDNLLDQYPDAIR